MRRLGPVAQILLYGSFRSVKGHSEAPLAAPAAGPSVPGKVIRSMGVLFKMEVGDLPQSARSCRLVYTGV